MELKYTTKIKLYNSYFDRFDRLSAKAILNIFQDVASYHGEAIGVGFKELLKLNLYWVISRIKVDIKRMPHPDETVIVETWPHEKGRIDFDRDLKISSEDGEVLIIGTSKWCVIDKETRSLQRTDSLNYYGEICKEINYTDRFGRIILPQTESKQVFSHIVRFTDLDHNIHMNNTNYATLVMNATEEKEFSHFEINFVNECLENDEIKVYLTKEDEKEFVYGMVDGELVFVAYIM